VVSGDGVGAERVGEVPRHPLGHPPRVHEDQRGAMLADQVGEPLVVFLPDLVRHDGVERRARHLEPEVHFAAVPFVDYRAGVRRRACAHQELRDFVNGLLGCRQSEPQKRRVGHGLQALQR